MGSPSQKSPMIQKLEEMVRTECLSHYGPDPYGPNQECGHCGKAPVRLYWSYYCPDAEEGYVRFGCEACSGTIRYNPSLRISELESRF